MFSAGRLATDGKKPAKLFMVPPHVIGGDYVNGKVSLFLNQRVSDNW
jgi:hypothetical protein